MKGKALVGGAAVLVMVGVACYWAQPFLTARSIASALAETDTERLRDHVDFESVRRSLKEQFAARLTSVAGDDGAGELDDPRVAEALDRMIDNYVTPDGLARMARGFDRDGEVEIAASGFETISRFHATIQRGAVDALTLVLRRNGLDWRLTALLLEDPLWRQFKSYRLELSYETGATLKAIFQALAARHEEREPGSPKAIAFPRTPPEPPCGSPYTWTDLDIAAWKTIGFSPPGPTNYSYSVATGESLGMDPMELMVVEAVGDLDCNGTTSYFALHLGETPGGQLYRAPSVYVDGDPLE